MRISMKSLNSLLLIYLATSVGVQAGPSEQTPLRSSQSNTANDANNEELKHFINDKFTDYVEHLMEIWHAKGMAIALVRPDGEVEFGAWGISTEDGDRVTRDTLFNIGSCSKAFLSASTGILMDHFDKGKNTTALPGQLDRLEWSTKAKDVLPDDWKLQDHWASEKASLRDILSHQSGLPRHDGSYAATDGAQDVVRNLRYLKPAYELREHYHYNNQMYMTGAYIISKYTGSYVDFATENIFRPLDMGASTFSYDGANKSGKMSHAWSLHDQYIPYWLPDDTSDLIAGAGGVITSVVDLSKWLKTLLNSGINPSKNLTVIPASAFDEITSAHTIAKGAAPFPESSILGYAMGWERFSYQGHEVVTHDGAIPGFSSLVSFLPNDNVGVAVLINTADMYAVASAVNFRLIEEALNLKKIDRAQDPSAVKPDRPSRSENASVPLALGAYSGTYGNKGYGSFTLCDPGGSSFYCNVVLRDFKAVDTSGSPPLPPPSDIPQLYGEWPRLWTSHVRMIHFEGNLFNISMTALFPAGYGQNTTAFEVYDGDTWDATAEFVVEGGKVIGFGMFNTGLSEEGVTRRGSTVEERADAWFRKV